MIRQLALVSACILGLARDDGPMATNGPTSPPRGHLVVVGGGPPIEEIYRRALDISGGEQARVLVVPFASPDPAAGEKSAAAWRALGATNVGVLDLSEPEIALLAIGEADLIWFRGGEQERLMRHLESVEGVIAAIHACYLRGGTIGGTSAGAAIMSRRMISGPAGRRGTPEAKLARFGTGLGLWPDVIVDQHFARRQRQLRLATAVHDFPELLGVGIDEATAVIVSGREFEVIGHGPVFVYGVRTPPPNPAEATQPSEPMPEIPSDISSLTMKAGMRYHLDHGLVAENATETVVAP